MINSKWIHRLVSNLPLFVLVFWLIGVFAIPNPVKKSGEFNKFLEAVENGEVTEATLTEDERELKYSDSEGETTTLAIPDNEAVIQRIYDSGVDLNFEVAAESVWWKSSWFFFLLYINAFILKYVILSKLKKVEEEDINVQKSVTTFDDVAGQDSAKTELKEVVKFLRDPSDYTAIGAKMPKGALLYGPPGTGKTLMAKAVAGEAGINFLYRDGSRFDELYVGVGQKRVEQLFQTAKENAPCIIFIDEIDGVGRSRNVQNQGEGSKTLNTLLTQMDGFDSNAQVFVIGATNRPEALDAAILRPGRFDIKVEMGRPDLQGRIDILKVHSKGYAFEPDVDLEKVARRVPGFTGADLANLLNVAAIIGVRQKTTTISNHDIEAAIDRVIAGAERKTLKISEETKKLVAYHEAGHAIVSEIQKQFFPQADEVQKISIIPRGGAGGLTWFAQDQASADSGLFPVEYLNIQICSCLGGRVAEEVVFGTSEVTVGAGNDLQKVRQLAESLVLDYGIFIEDIGPMALTRESSNYLGQQTQRLDVSEATRQLIDDKIKSITVDAYNKAKSILVHHRVLLDKVAEELIVKETIQRDEFLALVDQYQNREDLSL